MATVPQDKCQGGTVPKSERQPESLLRKLNCVLKLSNTYLFCLDSQTWGVYSLLIDSLLDGPPLQAEATLRRSNTTNSTSSECLHRKPLPRSSTNPQACGVGAEYLSFPPIVPSKTRRRACLFPTKVSASGSEEASFDIFGKSRMELPLVHV